MSSLLSLVTSSFSSKPSFHPAIGCLVAGLHVASMVLSSRPKAPNIVASGFSQTASRVRLDPTKTILHPLDASPSLPIAIVAIFALFGILFAVLAHKGFFSATSTSIDHNDARNLNDEDDDPPEPDDGAQDDRVKDEHIADPADQHPTNDGEEPPPPPPPGAANEAPHRRRHWFWALLWFALFLILPALWYFRGWFQAQLFAFLAKEQSKRWLLTRGAKLIIPSLASSVPTKILNDWSASLIEVLCGNPPLPLKVVLAITSVYSTMVFVDLCGWILYLGARPFLLVDGTMRRRFIVWVSLAAIYFVLVAGVSTFAAGYAEYVVLLCRFARGIFSSCWVDTLSASLNTLLVSAVVAVFVCYPK